MPARGVIEDGLSPPETAQDHKVVKVPVDDTRIGGVLHDRINSHHVSVDIKSVISARQQNVLGVGAVSRHTAVHTDLLQRHPFFIVGSHHGETGGAALQGLHLYDHRHLGSPLFHGLPDLRFTFPHPFQLLSEVLTLSEQAARQKRHPIILS